MREIIAAVESADINGRFSRMTLNPITLVFKGDAAELEEPFLGHYVENSLRQVRFAVLLGVLFYASFGLLDYDRAASLEFDLARLDLRNLIFDLILVEQRDFTVVVRHLSFHTRRGDGKEFHYLADHGLGVAYYFGDLTVEDIRACVKYAIALV